MKYWLLTIVCYFYVVSASCCKSEVYCRGLLLDLVQKSRIFNDSKTFVDLIQVNPEKITLDNFKTFLKDTKYTPTKLQIEAFVKRNFEREGELDHWTPTDYNKTPKIIEHITDDSIKNFAKIVISIWPKLARKIKIDVRKYPDRHSLIFLPNGFIVPGGRFQEIYYWDSYWIIKGLLISEMYNTVRGMLENFIHLVEIYGFIPNGSRVYYLSRSQPPLLSLMVGLYIDVTGNITWLAEHVESIAKELKWWLTNRIVMVEKDGVLHMLAHYASDSTSPRPESYYEDYRTCAEFEKKTDKENCYKNLKSAAESGWDFSTRWTFDQVGNTSSNITNVQARRVIPVDLNAYLCRGFKELSRFYDLLGATEQSKLWLSISQSWQKSIQQVLYNKEDGIWYDYDTILRRQRNLFYPSNFAPLWTESYELQLGPMYGLNAAQYLLSQGVLSFTGGIPTSLDKSGQQWDLPNAFPPLQEIVILGLHKTGNADAQQIALTFADRLINSFREGYRLYQVMFEKYDAVHPGQRGGGGEYNVQTGFGWTNGVALSLIDEFYTNSSSSPTFIYR